MIEMEEKQAVERADMERVFWFLMHFVRSISSSVRSTKFRTTIENGSPYHGRSLAKATAVFNVK